MTVARRRVSHAVLIRAESERDQLESTLTVPMRQIFTASPSVLAAIFVDSEGECVDYCASMDVYDAKVAAAQMQVVLEEVRVFGRRVEAGRPAMLEILGLRRSFVVREVGEGYAVVVVVAGPSIDVSISWALDECIRALRQETALPTPSWDPECDLDVQTRRAIGWEFAPASFALHGQRHVIADVLGRWHQEGGLSGSPLICFRVRDTRGAECTLAFDSSEELWLRW